MKVDIIFVDVSNSVMLFKLKLTRWRPIEASAVVSFSESNRHFVHVQSKSDNRHFMALNPHPWILEKQSKRGTVTERVSREKIQSAALHHWYMSLCFGFFPDSALGDGPKNGIYFCSARHLSTHIGIWNWHHRLAQMAFWIFIQKTRSVMVPKIHR